MKLSGLSPWVREELAAWRRVRRYAVPRWMIEEATRRRLAGDVAGACAAAGVDLRFDPDRVGGAIAEDLRHLAPDLLRWHLPRQATGRGALLGGAVVVLAGYRGRGCLYAKLPGTPAGPQRISLRVGDPPPYRVLERWQWDVRRVGDLRRRCGGDDRRVPFFHPDGTRLRGDELPDGPRPDDPVATTEWITMLWQGGRVGEALALCGAALADGEPDRWSAPPPVSPERVVAEARAVAVGRPARVAVRGRPVFGIEVDGSGAVTLRRSNWGRDEPRLVDEDRIRYPVDFDLVRFGYLALPELHPLVKSTLFPALEARAGDGAQPATALVPVRVWCRGEWHLVRAAPGGLRIPHPDGEYERELVLRAFGGDLAGCFQARYAWSGGAGRLPRALRLLRRDVFHRAFHGDAPGVVALLEAGLDPAVRSGDGSTLSDFLSHLDLRPGGAAAVRHRLRS